MTSVRPAYVQSLFESYVRQANGEDEEFEKEFRDKLAESGFAVKVDLRRLKKPLHHHTFEAFECFVAETLAGQREEADESRRFLDSQGIVVRRI